jgi:hypothetical protein
VMGTCESGVALITIYNFSMFLLFRKGCVNFCVCNIANCGSIHEEGNMGISIF